MPCAHGPCSCQITNVRKDGKPFCSSECATAAQSAGAGSCPCGHEHCRPQVHESDVDEKSIGEAIVEAGSEDRPVGKIGWPVPPRP